jgi:hypothetical protein
VYSDDESWSLGSPRTNLRVLFLSRDTPDAGGKVASLSDESDESLLKQNRRRGDGLVMAVYLLKNSTLFLSFE